MQVKSEAVRASTTERIKFGTAIAVAFPRSPMITAYIAWDLQKASVRTDDPPTRLAGEGPQREAFLSEVRVLPARSFTSRCRRSAPSGTAGKTVPSSTSRASFTASTTIPIFCSLLLFKRKSIVLELRIEIQAKVVKYGRWPGMSPCGVLCLLARERPRSAAAFRRRTA